MTRRQFLPLRRLASPSCCNRTVTVARPLGFLDTVDRYSSRRRVAVRSIQGVGRCRIAPANRMMNDPSIPSLRRVHLTRLNAIWRSAGWPCRDAIELDLLAAGYATQVRTADGHEIVRPSERGLRALAELRQQRRRSLSTHDRLAELVCNRLLTDGRIVWRELSLRAGLLDESDSPNEAQLALDVAPSPESEPGADETLRKAAKVSWRVARPDVFSIRQTSVEAYLHPMVHEIKASRADLLSDLRSIHKRASYQSLSCETYYVFPASVASPDEIPDTFGVWLVTGPLENPGLEIVRPAHHAACRLPFHVWLALARAVPLLREETSAQHELVDCDGELSAPSESPAADAPLRHP